MASVANKDNLRASENVADERVSPGAKLLQVGGCQFDEIDVTTKVALRCADPPPELVATRGTHDEKVDVT
jgi:hypothetical protein